MPPKQGKRPRYGFISKEDQKTSDKMLLDSVVVILDQTTGLDPSPKRESTFAGISNRSSKLLQCFGIILGFSNSKSVKQPPGSEQASIGVKGKAV